MSDTLTQLLTKIQTILGDDGTIFTTATVTAAVRQALSDFNRVAPIFGAELITGVNLQYEYELSDFDASAIQIIDILLQGRNGNEIDKSITYDDYYEDERVFFRLRAPVTTSDTLIVRYTLLHTISGLDSATESTLLAKDDQAMINGGAFYSIMTRATSRIETINLSQDQSDNYREIAGLYYSAFVGRLAAAARQRKAPVGEPDTRAWNDDWHSWRQ